MNIPVTRYRQAQLPLARQYTVLLPHTKKRLKVVKTELYNMILLLHSTHIYLFQAVKLYDWYLSNTDSIDGVTAEIRPRNTLKQIVLCPR